MLDVSRHFFNASEVKHLLRTMATWTTWTTWTKTFIRFVGSPSLQRFNPITVGQ
jgi:hypothetical protein